MASKESNEVYTQDSAIKELFMDFPEDSVRMLLPDLEQLYGPIQEVEFPRQEMKKQWLEDQGRELDIPIKVRCQKGNVVLVLLEHKSNKKTFSIYKLAYYTLDLMQLYPGYEIVPVVLFADQTTWRKDVPRSLSLDALGHRWLDFTYLKVKLKDMSAEQAAESDNPVKQILSPLMDCKTEKRVSLLYRVYTKLKQLIKPQLYLKYVTFIDKYSKIDKEQRDQIKADIRSGHQGGHMLSEILLEHQQIIDEKDSLLHEKDDLLHEQAKEIEKLHEVPKLIACELLRQGHDPQSIASATHLPLSVIKELQQR